MEIAFQGTEIASALTWHGTCLQRRYVSHAAGWTARLNNAHPDEIEPLRAELRKRGVFIARDDDRDEQRASLAIREARAGRAGVAIELARGDWIHPVNYLPILATELACRCSKRSVTALLSLAGRSLETAIEICVILTRGYSDAAVAIADALLTVTAARTSAPDPSALPALARSSAGARARAPRSPATPRSAPPISASETRALRAMPRRIVVMLIVVNDSESASQCFDCPLQVVRQFREVVDSSGRPRALALAAASCCSCRGPQRPLVSNG